MEQLTMENLNLNDAEIETRPAENSPNNITENTTTETKKLETTGAGTSITPKMLRKVARKPFQIQSIDPAKDKEKEMAVFTHAKKLSEYIFVITEKAPKKYRWSIISRLQNTIIDVVSNLYHANFERDDKRLYYQTCAGVSLYLLNHYTEVAQKLQAITTKQMHYIGRMILEERKLLGGWAKSVKK